MFEDMLEYAKFLCAGSYNEEYIRGQAELLAQFAPEWIDDDMETTVDHYIELLTHS